MRSIFFACHSTMVLMQTFWNLFQQINHTLKSNPHLAVSLKFQSFDDFDCTLCAQCCMQPWDVSVEESFYDRWFETYRHHESGKYKDVVKKYPDPNPMRYAYVIDQPGGHRCSFLEDDNRCFLHRVYGADAKPKGCQLYPKRLISTGQQTILSHLMPSCRGVPNLWENEPELIYHYIDKRDPQSFIPVVGDRLDDDIITLSGQDSLTVYAYHLWVALVFDALMLKGTPTQNLRYVSYALYLLDKMNQDIINEAMLTQIYPIYLNYVKNHGIRKVHDKKMHAALSWFVHFAQDSELMPVAEFYYEIMQGKRKWPRLSLAKRKYLSHFIRNYLFHYSLIYRSWFIKGFNLFQEHTVLVMSYSVILLVVLYEHIANQEPLDIEVMKKVTNLISIRITHKRDWMLPATDTEQCFKIINLLLEIDFLES